MSVKPAKNPTAGTGWIRATVTLLPGDTLLAVGISNDTVNWAERSRISLYEGEVAAIGYIRDVMLSEGYCGGRTMHVWNGVIKINRRTTLVGAVYHHASATHEMTAYVG